MATPNLSPLRWINVFSLDAVAVAVAWQSAITSLHTGRSVTWNQHAAMAMITWLVYTADRWLDARGPRHRHRPTHRHEFFRRHRHGSALAWVAGAVIFAGISLTTFDSRQGFISAAAAIVVAVYLICRARWQRPKTVDRKSFVVAALFSYGMHILAIDDLLRNESIRSPANVLPIVASWFTVAALVFVNCRGVNHLKRAAGETPNRTINIGDAWVVASIAWLSMMPSVRWSRELAIAAVVGWLLVRTLTTWSSRKLSAMSAATRSICSTTYDACLIVSALVL